MTLHLLATLFLVHLVFKFIEVLMSLILCALLAIFQLMAWFIQFEYFDRYFIFPAQGDCTIE